MVRHQRLGGSYRLQALRGQRKRKGRMMAWVYGVVVGKGPRQYKFPLVLWTQSVIGALIGKGLEIRLIGIPLFEEAR